MRLMVRGQLAHSLGVSEEHSWEDRTRRRESMVGYAFLDPEWQALFEKNISRCLAVHPCHIKKLICLSG